MSTHIVAGEEAWAKTPSRMARHSHETSTSAHKRPRRDGTLPAGEDRPADAPRGRETAKRHDGARLTYPIVTSLPDDLLRLVARIFIAAADIPSAQALRETCRDVRDKMHDLRREEEDRRLRWMPQVTNAQVIIAPNNLIVGGPAQQADATRTWAASAAFPAGAAFSFEVRIEHSRGNDGGGIFVGVCDAQAAFAWSVALFNGELRTCRRTADQLVNTHLARPPEGYPGNNGLSVMPAWMLGRPPLEGRTNGTVIIVSVEPDATKTCLCLSFTFDGVKGKVLRGFPLETCVLRPFVRLTKIGDRVQLKGWRLGTLLAAHDARSPQAPSQASAADVG